ncbi:MAG TPA: thermonuclease family protein [Rhodospirillales bacterium]|nr:thermonuclease family protein [Rhodospirillales bacterium]
MKQTCRTSKGKKQMCGQLAKQALEWLVKGQDVTCKGDTRDKYKRLLAVCYVGPFNINKQMVVDGWALAYRKYSKDYVRAETFAKSRREGIWRGEFEPPWEFVAAILFVVFILPIGAFSSATVKCVFRCADGESCGSTHTEIHHRTSQGDAHWQDDRKATSRF